MARYIQQDPFSPSILDAYSLEIEAIKSHLQANWPQAHPDQLVGEFLIPFGEVFIHVELFGLPRFQLRIWTRWPPKPPFELQATQTDKQVADLATSLQTAAECMSALHTHFLSRGYIPFQA